MERATKLIKKFEGFSMEAYQDLAGVWTIGYGHTACVKPGDCITTTEANRLLKTDIQRALVGVENHVNILLQPYEREALVSFVFNVGEYAFKSSTLLKLLNYSKSRRDRIKAAAEFCRWIYSDKVAIRGLLRRRQAEQMLFLFGMV